MSWGILTDNVQYARNPESVTCTKHESRSLFLSVVIGMQHNMSLTQEDLSYYHFYPVQLIGSRGIYNQYFRHRHQESPWISLTHPFVQNTAKKFIFIILRTPCIFCNEFYIICFIFASHITSINSWSKESLIIMQSLSGTTSANTRIISMFLNLIISS